MLLPRVTRCFLGIVVVILLLVGGRALYWRLSLPSYGGRNAAEWFELTFTSESDPDLKIRAHQAFSKMGAKAAPFLGKSYVDALEDLRVVQFLDRIRFDKQGRVRRIPTWIVAHWPQNMMDVHIRRHNASHLLSQLGPDAAGEAQRLLPYVHHAQDWLGVNEVLSIIARFGPAASNCIPDIGRLMEADNQSVRMQAAITLTAMATPKDHAVALLEQAVLHKRLRAGTLVPSISRLQGNVRSLIPALASELRSADQGDAYDALRALSFLGEDRPMLLEDCLVALKGSDPRFRAALLRVIREMAGETAVDPYRIIPCLSDEYYYVRAEAARTLGAIGPPARAALPALEALHSDHHEEVRETVAAVIAELAESQQ